MKKAGIEPLHAAAPVDAGNSARTSLGRRSAVAFLWGAGGSVTRIVLQLVAQVALARILGPETFGLFAIGVLVVGVASYFADFGLAYGLIQRLVVDEDDIRFVWTWQCILGVGVATAIWASAGSLAMYFGKPESEIVFTWLSLVCVLNALAAPSTNLLKKALNYKALQIAQVVSYIGGYVVVGLLLALAGFGLGALVSAMVVQGALNFAILYAYARHPIGWRIRHSGGLAMLRYGATVLGTNLINWLLSNVDKMMVGRLFPAYVVGLYATAFNLVNSPATAAYSNLQSVVFAAGAQMQDDLAGQKAAFIRLLAGVFLVGFPLFALIAAGAEIAVTAIYGQNWIECAPYLRIFAFAMPSLLVWGISTPVLWNTGRTSLELRIQIPLVLIWTTVLFTVSGTSPTAIALASASLLVGRSTIMAIVASRLLSVSIGEFMRAIVGGLSLTTLMTVCGLYAVAPVAQLVQNAQLQLAIFSGVGGAAYIAAIVIFGPHFIEASLAQTLSSRVAHLPRSAAVLVRVATRGRS